MKPLIRTSDPPADELWVWGVDVSTKRIAIACHGPDSTVRLREYGAKLRTGARLSEIYAAVVVLARDIAEARPPLFVWVEQPAAYGRMPEPQLMYAVGVAQAAIYAALEQRHEHPTEVRTIAVAEWKKRAVGHGNAKKYQVLDWAKNDGLETDHSCDDLVRTGKRTCTNAAHDAADAWAIGRAGARMLGVDEGQLPIAS